MIEIRKSEKYLKWFGKLKDRIAKKRIQARLIKLSEGYFGDVKPVGHGVSEFRIDYGPGYRIYYMQRGKALVILLAGGDKSTQSKDIETAIHVAHSMKEE